MRAAAASDRELTRASGVASIRVCARGFARRPASWFPFPEAPRVTAISTTLDDRFPFEGASGPCLVLGTDPELTILGASDACPRATIVGRARFHETVQRGITRHADEVWAESALDRDATFLFMLGDPT
jgi:hypothetical protein